MESSLFALPLLPGGKPDIIGGAAKTVPASKNSTGPRSGSGSNDFLQLLQDMLPEDQAAGAKTTPAGSAQPTVPSQPRISILIAPTINADADTSGGHSKTSEEEKRSACAVEGEAVQASVQLKESAPQFIIQQLPPALTQASAVVTSNENSKDGQIGKAEGKPTHNIGSPVLESPSLTDALDSASVAGSSVQEADPVSVLSDALSVGPGGEQQPATTQEAHQTRAANPMVADALLSALENDTNRQADVSRSADVTRGKAADAPAKRSGGGPDDDDVRISGTKQDDSKADPSGNSRINRFPTKSGNPASSERRVSEASAGSPHNAKRIGESGEELKSTQSKASDPARLKPEGASGGNIQMQEGESKTSTGEAVARETQSVEHVLAHPEQSVSAGAPAQKDGSRLPDSAPGVHQADGDAALNRNTVQVKPSTADADPRGDFTGKSTLPTLPHDGTVQKSGAERGRDGLFTLSGDTQSLPVDLSRSVVDQLVKEIGLQVNGETSEMRLTLKPEALGEVALKVRMEDGKMQAQIDVSQLNVKAALETSLPQLRQALSDRGIEVQRIDVFTPGQSLSGESREGQPDRQKRKAGKQIGTLDALEQYDSVRHMGYNTMEIVM